MFAFKLNYQDNDTGGSYTVPSLYNGNISETFWRTSSDNTQRKYGYIYDNLNRLTNATYQKPQAANPVRSSYNEALSYDKNGNIMTLNRTGEYDDADYQLEIDNLAYTYNPDNKNQLMKVYDSTNNTNGFKDDSTGTSDPADDYKYDANGNMTIDANKQITNIVYNHLNLPTKIIFNNDTTTRIEYLYNAAGVKLQKTTVQGSTVNTTLYFDGFQYVNNVLQFFPHAEGYVNNTVVNGNNVYNYVFNYTDHLGNIRVSYGVDPATSVLKVLEENNYYPFGLKHKNYNMSQKTYIKNGSGVGLEPCTTCPRGYQYKYNGKELQDELGLNVYDMDARQYDPAIARWVVQDPVVHHNLSPYNAFDNNPIYWADPSGMDGEHYDWTTGNYLNDKDEIITFSDVMASQGLNDGGTDSNGSENQAEQKPPKSLLEWIKSIFTFKVNSMEEYKERENNREIFKRSAKVTIKTGKMALGIMATIMTLPVGGEGGEAVAALEASEAKGLYTVVKESSSKYSVVVESGSASSFYKILNPAWTGKLYQVDAVYAQATFKTADGVLVKLTTTSSSTGQATVKIMAKNIQYLFRFPTF